MRKTLFITTMAMFMLVILPGTSSAGALDDFARAMGADKLKTIEITGTGFYFHLGGSNISSEPWPKFNLKSYRQRINYETATMGLDLTLTQALFPPRGAGFQPIRGTKLRQWYISGDVGWGYGRKGEPRAARSTSRYHHALWTSPHGVVKAAQDANSQIKMRKSGGKTYKTVSFGKNGAFTAIAWFNKDNMLVGVDARIENAVMGDMPSTTLYSDYKDFSGIKYPTRIKVTYGDHPGFDIKITDVKPNASIDIATPKNLKKRITKVKSEKIADGIWYLRGGSHHSVTMEMKDHVIVYEGPLHEKRGKAVIDATRKLVPGKQIRYVINSHHHFDHSGGLRAFAAEGITIVTHQTNKAFYRNAYANPTKIKPDHFAKSRKKAKFLTVENSYKLSDGNRVIELYTLTGNTHSETNLIAYLPKEKILIVADAYSARSIYKEPVKQNKVNPARELLWQTLVELRLDIQTVLPIHGKKVGVDQIRLSAGLQ